MAAVAVWVAVLLYVALLDRPRAATCSCWPPTRCRWWRCRQWTTRAASSTRPSHVPKRSAWASSAPAWSAPWSSPPRSQRAARPPGAVDGRRGAVGRRHAVAARCRCGGIASPEPAPHGRRHPGARPVDQPAFLRHRDRRAHPRCQGTARPHDHAAAGAGLRPARSRPCSATKPAYRTSWPPA